MMVRVADRIYKGQLYHMNRLLLLLITFILWSEKSGATAFDLVTATHKVTIVYEEGPNKLDSISAHLLAADIQRVTGYLPVVLTDLKAASGNVILIGGLRSGQLNRFKNQLNLHELEGKWECYQLKILAHPAPGISNALIIAGSDARGTAFGVFDISEKIGVNPWYWWADVLPVQKKNLTIQLDPYSSVTPSVKYRGIFINDEDWGLRPWAAKTFEPETKDIGPKTYEKVFELLLRLKANLIWPAMHPGTKAFFSYAGNRKMASDYQIVVGSSHAEPMLRNNVSEWDKQSMGDFNYVTNSANVNAYWESRVKESSAMEAIYSLGMRGIHDSGIEGVKTMQETLPLLTNIIDQQRSMLSRNLNKNMTSVPQAFTAYKEVLEIYDAGLKLPDDVTIVWPDDNYGYIQRLNTNEENKRSGGSGVYYHASYWGRPHDYLWLGTTHPALIREEMLKAYEMNARKVWVLNVGDIKPAEYQLQLFMDMAWNIDPFKINATAKTHLQHWISHIFDNGNSGSARQTAAITDALWNYYHLAFERKPEFMGWSQTEPTTGINFSAYNHHFYGDQAQRRIDAFKMLEKQLQTLNPAISKNRRDSFYQLVTYPVRSAVLMNEKFIYRDKAFLYAKQGRLIAKYYAGLAAKAYQQIVTETAYYNDRLMSGKWAGMMSMNPRNLPVFQLPDLQINITKQKNAWKVIPEGYTDTLSPSSARLPAEKRGIPLTQPVLKTDTSALLHFSSGMSRQFVDIFLCSDTALNYTVTASKPWIKTSATKGRLTPDERNSQQRLWITIDWANVPSHQKLLGELRFNSGNTTYILKVEADHTLSGLPADFRGFTAQNGYVSIYAKNYTAKTAAKEQYWGAVSGLGLTEQSMEALPLRSTPFKTDYSEQEIRQQPALSYDFYTPATQTAEITIYTLPSLPLNKNFGMRFAVSLDDAAPVILNFKTAGRTEEWKQNVLSNSAHRSVRIPGLTAGKHRLKIYSIDPGVIADRMIIDLGGLKPFYGLIPETKAQ